MIIKPMIRNSICLNSHPKGCAAVVRNQIAYISTHLGAGKSPADLRADGIPKLALVIGCSTGYGLASRIAAGFGYGAATIGVSLEKAASITKPGTPGYYNNRTFDAEAAKQGLVSQTLNGDAFSDEMKEDVVTAIKETAAIPPKIDLIIYSLASPVRTDPESGVMYRSVIKPIGGVYMGKTLDMMSGKLGIATVQPATEEEITHTVKVMGGADWERWIAILDKAGLLSLTVRTIAYTYIGPELSWAIYKNGTIGRAKEDLERSAGRIHQKLSQRGGAAWVSVNKALVTRASVVIPIIPFYVSCLFKVMKEKGLHETCIEQITRLYRDRLYTPDAALDPGKVPVDSERRIRLDDWEMREDVQQETLARMEQTTEATVFTATDVEGFKHDFLEAHGFDVPGIDYDDDVVPTDI